MGSSRMCVSGLLMNPHVWASALFDEIAALGYPQSYPTFVRKIRHRGLRPSCGACSGTKGRPSAIIDHPPGEECQWDWVELGDTPWGSKAYVLVGALSHSGRFRAWITTSQDQPHLVEAIDAVLRRLGGTARRWRVDRMATVIVPGTGRFTAVVCSGGEALRGWGWIPCPPYRPQRKGVGGKGDPLCLAALVAHRHSYQSWAGRRTASTASAYRWATPAPRDNTTVGDLADSEPLLELPVLAYEPVYMFV